MTDQDQILSTLNDMKAVDIVTLDVRTITTITDTMVIVSGNNTRHVRSIMNALLDIAPKLSYGKPTIEGDDHCEWILVNFGDIIVHIMQPQIREYYAIEKLWSQ